jgi:hypothetical protein
MKKALIILLLLTVGALADNISPTDTVTLVGRMILSDGNNAQPDSIRIMTYRAGSQVYDTWFNSSDAECYSSDDALIFFDRFSDIDGSGGDGHYSVEVGAYGGGEELYTYWYYDFTVGGLDVNVVDIEDSTLGNIADSVWDDATRELTALDEDNTTIDLDGTTVGTVTNVSDKEGYALTYGEKTSIADSVKNHVGIDSSRTAFGDSLRFALGDSCSGDGGSDTTAIKEMMNNNYWGWHYNILGDSGSFGDSAHWASYFQKVGGDSSLWIHPEDMWRNIDTLATIDTSDVGDWMVSNLSGGGGFDYEQVWYNIDTTNIDTSDIGDWMIDNIAGESGVWNATQRDSVLSAIKDSILHYKVWHDSSLNELTALNENNTDIDVSLSVNKGVWDVAYNSTFSYGSVGDSLFNPGPSFVSKIDSALVSLGYDGSDDLHTKVNNLSLSGGGTEPETLIVLALEDSIAIQGARITVRTLDQSTVKVPGLTTDVNGKRILELDTDSFYVALTANNYVQATDTLVVLYGGETDTLFLSEFDPGDPIEPDLCRVFGWVYDISGDSLSGIEVSAEIPRDYHPVKYSGIVITPFSKSTQTDSSGYWHIDLFPNSVLSDTTSNYLFTIKYHSGVIYRTEMAVPDSTSWQLE